MQSTLFFLCSQRIGFRRWTHDDLPLARNLWGDPAVTRLISKEPMTDAQIQERLNTEVERANTDKMQYWPMFEIATGQHIGCAGLRPYRSGDRIYELGFHLLSTAWGKGFATEAGKRLIDYAFEDLHATAIFAGHHPDNAASKNVLLKLGFQQIGTEFYEPTGLMHPGYMLYPK